MRITCTRKVFEAGECQAMGGGGGVGGAGWEEWKEEGREGGGR